MYRLVRGQLVLLIDRTSSSGDNTIARIVDDILLRQAHWAEDIKLENGALERMEASDEQATSVVRLVISDILNLLLVEGEQAISSPQSQYEVDYFIFIVGLTKIREPLAGTEESLSLLMKLNDALCDQVEIFDSLSALENAESLAKRKTVTEIELLRHRLENQDLILREQSTKNSVSKPEISYEPAKKEN
ncbi:MAG: hypothetical protein Q9214_006705 [Letrouitia sp. 1 TL-2023]